MEESKNKAFDKKGYDLSYAKNNLVRIPLNLNRSTDGDIISWMDKQSNKQGYIKQLIRNDIRANDSGGAYEYIGDDPERALCSSDGENDRRDR